MENRIKDLDDGSWFLGNLRPYRNKLLEYIQVMNLNENKNI